MIQQTLGHGTIQRNGRRRRRQVELDASGRFAQEDPETQNLVVALVLALPILVAAARAAPNAWGMRAYEQMDREARAADALELRMRRSGFTAERIAQFVAHAAAAASAATSVLAEAGSIRSTDTARTARASEVGNLITQINQRPSMRAFYGGRMEAVEAAEERRDDPFQVTVGQLRTWLRHPGNRALLERAPGPAAAVMAEIILRRIPREAGAIDRFFDRLERMDRRLLEAVSAGDRTVRIIRGESAEAIGASLGRVLLHALMGEWYEGHGEVSSEWDVLADRGVTSADAEADMEDAASVIVDTGISVIPVIDQLADARDLSAYAFRMLDLDGHHAEAISDPWQWTGLVMTFIGFIPELGSVLKGVGKLLLRFGGRIAETVRRLAPELVDRLRPFMRDLGSHWRTVRRSVRAEWYRMVARVDRWFDAAGGAVRRAAGAVYTRWQEIKAAATEMIPAGLRRAYDAFTSFAQQLMGRASDLGAGIVERARRGRSFVRQYSATGRLHEEVARLDAAESALRAAIARADTGAIENLTVELADAVGDLERRLATTSDAPVGPPARGSEPRPSAEERRALRESADHEPLTHELLDHELDRVRGGERRPSTEPGYDVEVEIGNGHVWRRHADGRMWCRWSEEPTQCVPAAVLEQSEEAGSRLLREYLDDPDRYQGAAMIDDMLEEAPRVEVANRLVVAGLARPHPQSLQADLEERFRGILENPDQVRARITALVADPMLADIGLGSGRSADEIAAEMAMLQRRRILQERFAAFARAEQSGVDRALLQSEASALRNALSNRYQPIPPSQLPNVTTPPSPVAGPLVAPSPRTVTSGLERTPDDLFLPGEIAGPPPAAIDTVVSRLPGAIAAPAAGQASAIRYLGLTSEGEPRGVDAILNASDIHTGPRPRLETPHGWEARLGYHRTHLLAHMLGGSRNRNNLVTAASEANSYGVGTLRPSNMLEFEWQVRRALEAGQTVHYRVIPIYEGQSMPVAIAMQARGSGDDGITLNVVIRNWTHHRGSDTQ